MTDTFFAADIDVVKQTDVLLAEFDKLPDQIMEQLKADLQHVAQDLVNKIKPLVPVKTGALRDSLTPRVQVIGKDEISVVVRAGSNLKYARIQDKGGNIPPHREPKMGMTPMILPFDVARRGGLPGDSFIVGAVNHPGARITGKEFMMAGLLALKQDFITVTEHAVATAVIQNMRGT